MTVTTPSPPSLAAAAAAREPSPHGTIIVEGEKGTLLFRRRLPHAIETVWAALTEPAQRAVWFGATEIDAREGGTISMVPDDPPVPRELKRMTGRIISWDPPRVFEHTWQQSIVEEGSVRYELVPDGPDATILTFTHRGLSLRNASGFIPGTHAYLDRLEAHLSAADIPGWQERFNEVAPSYGGAWMQG
jgi:uncharacterized protein YndB with AHSA1/START domain